MANSLDFPYLFFFNSWFTDVSSPESIASILVGVGLFLAVLGEAIKKTKGKSKKEIISTIIEDEISAFANLSKKNSSKSENESSKEEDKKKEE